jgi:hypothetical protein
VREEKKITLSMIEPFCCSKWQKKTPFYVSERKKIMAIKSKGHILAHFTFFSAAQ